jgi:signal peptidase II
MKGQPPKLRSFSRFLIVTLTLLSCVGCDQVSKSAARSLLTSGITESFFAGALRLQLVQNPGSFLSLGASLPEPVRFILFIGAVGLLLLGILYAALFAKRLDFGRSIALALLAGGGLSNLLDRLIYAGRVTDFLNIGIGALRTGIFNLADMAIIAGAALLVLTHPYGSRLPPPQPH